DVIERDEHHVRRALGCARRLERSPVRIRVPHIDIDGSLKRVTHLALHSTTEERPKRPAPIAPSKHLLQPWVTTYAYLRPKSTLDDGFTRRLRRNSRVDIKQPMTYPADEACEVGAEHRLARLTGHGPLQLRLRARRRRLYAWFSRPTRRRWALSRR